MVDRGRSILTERLVRALVAVDVTKLVEALLLPLHRLLVSCHA
jgi:hypothetical protein